MARPECLDCGMDTRQAGEYYMLRPDVWLTAHPDGTGMLCVGCVEQRLGRRLERPDFVDCAINGLPTTTRSKRLKDRLSGPGDLQDTNTLSSFAFYLGE
jgi:hypothetical protein